MPSIPNPFAIDVLGPLLRAFFGNSGLDALQKITNDAPGYMLPDPALLTGSWAWLVGFMAALGGVIGLIFFGVAAISAGTLGDARKLGQSVMGIMACAVAMPATLAIYAMLRGPMIDTAHAILSAQAVTSWAEAAEKAGQSETIAIIATFASCLALALAAGVLGFGMLLALLFAPIAVAFSVFASGSRITIKWIATTIVLLFAPVIAAVGIAITSIVVGSAGYGPTGWVVTFSGIAMSAAAPFLVLSRVGDFGGGAAAQRGNASVGQTAGQGIATATAGKLSSKAAKTAGKAAA